MQQHPSGTPAAAATTSNTSYRSEDASDTFRSCNNSLPASNGSLDLATGCSAIDMRGLLLSLLEVASALSYLHRMGIVHCDVKVRGQLGAVCLDVSRDVSSHIYMFSMKLCFIDFLARALLSYLCFFSF